MNWTDFGLGAKSSVRCAWRAVIRRLVDLRLLALTYYHHMKKHWCNSSACVMKGMNARYQIRHSGLERTVYSPIGLVSRIPCLQVLFPNSAT